MQSYGTMIATQAGLTDVTRSGGGDISQRQSGAPRQGGQPEGSGPSGAVDKLSYPAAVAVWIGAGLLGWGLIAGLVFTLA